jgi:uncharacterized protein YdhG (YjbR/CyaY superfamily)
MNSRATSKSRTEQGKPQVDAYLAALPEQTRSHLQELREAIRATARGAVECFGYGIPGFSINGKPFIWYGAWKRHCSLYPVSNETLRALASEVAGFETTGKGTIQFPLSKPVPTGLVKRLVKARVTEVLRKRKKG